jgi:hypothetical protein
MSTALVMLTYSWLREKPQGTQETYAENEDEFLQ